MTAPLTSRECDCRGLPYMPLDVVRLRDSDLAALSTGEEFKAAVLLWCAAWNQLPAGSLPNDERILAKLAGYSLGEWRGLAASALRGWVVCDDGRLYHPVIAAKATEAYAARIRQRARAAKRWGTTAEPAPDSPAMPPHSHGTDDPMPRHADGEATAMPGKGKCIGIDSSLSPTGDEKPPKPQRLTDYPAAFDEAWRAYPHIKGRSSKPRSLSAWRRLPDAVRQQLPAAAKRFRNEGREPRADCGAPAMDRWLRDAKYEDWVAAPIEQAPPAVDEDTAAMRLAHLEATGEWREGWGARPTPNLRVVG